MIDELRALADKWSAAEGDSMDVRAMHACAIELEEVIRLGGLGEAAQQLRDVDADIGDELRAAIFRPKEGP